MNVCTKKEGGKPLKARLDFVTNSSSSSFIINKSDLTSKQIELLLNRDKLLELVREKYSAPCENQYDDSFFEDDVCLKCESYPCEAAGWTIREEGDKIIGFTLMDNFDMISFLRSLGIPIADYDDSQTGMKGINYLYEKYGVDPYDAYDDKEET